MKNGIVLSVTISKTSDDKGEYLQVISADALSINVVFVADKINVHDTRKRP